MNCHWRLYTQTWTWRHTLCFTQNETPPSCFVGAKLREPQVKWVPCEIEAFSIAAAINYFSLYIIQSAHQTHVLTDCKPCVWESETWWILSSSNIFYDREPISNLHQTSCWYCQHAIKLCKPQLPRVFPASIPGVSVYCADWGHCCARFIYTRRAE